jgi:hypothetical protein
MKPFIHTWINAFGEEVLDVVYPSSKEQVERDLMRPLTQEEYEAHVWQMADVKDPKARHIELEDRPASREFRNAWCDHTPESRIDIHVKRACAHKLKDLRLKRDHKLKESDLELVRLIESGDKKKLDELKDKRQALRDCTEGLKALQIADDLYNCDETLQTISNLGKLPE